VHHLLTLYGLGAPASVIEKQYKQNASYQRPNLPVEERNVEDMSNPEHFQKYLGKEKYYRDFLIFWQSEMEKKGWESVLNEYLFAGSDRADVLLTRMYAGTFLLSKKPPFDQLLTISQDSCTPLSIWGLESNSNNQPSSRKP
jgi:hypothetical protein